MPQIPRYRPQAQPATPRQIPYEAATQGAEAMFRFGETMRSASRQAQQMHLEYLDRLRQQTVRNEVNSARVRWQEEVTDFYGQYLAPDSAYVTEEGQEEPNYMRAPVEFERLTERFANEADKSFRFAESQQQFHERFDLDRVVQTERVTSDSREYLREVQRSDHADHLAHATRHGDLEFVTDLVEGALQGGVISEAEANEQLQNAFFEVQVSGHARTAREMGFEEGLQYLADSSNLTWRDPDGNESRIPEEAQKRLIDDLRRERNAQRSEAEYARREADRRGNEQAQRLHRTGQLSYSWIQDPENGLTWQSREHWWNMKAREDERMAEIADSGDTEGDDSTLEDLYARSARGEDPVRVQDDALNAFTDGRLSETQYRTFMNWDRQNNPWTVLEDAYEYFDTVAEDQELDELQLGELRREFRKRVLDDRFIEEGPEGWVLNEDRLDQDQIREMARNLADPYVVDELYEKEFGFDERRLMFRKVTNPEEFLRAIEEGRLTGVEDEYAEELTALEEGHARMAETLFGREPDHVTRSARGMPQFVYDGLRYRFTFDEDEKDERLMVWHGTREEWIPVPHDTVAPDEEAEAKRQDESRSVREVLGDTLRNITGETRRREVAELSTEERQRRYEAAREDIRSRIGTGYLRAQERQAIYRSIADTHGLTVEDVRAIHREMQ